MTKSTESKKIHLLDWEQEFLATSDNVHQEMQLFETPFTKCEQALKISPILSAIIFCNKNRFKVQHRSFRVAVSQIVRRTQEAFTMANKNVNEVQARTLQMLKEGNRAVALLITESDENLKQLLEVTLMQILRSPSYRTPANLSEEIEESFKRITEMITDLHEVTMDAEEETREEMKELKSGLSDSNEDLSGEMVKGPMEEREKRLKLQQEGLQVLGDLRKQYAKLLEFFESLTAMLKQVEHVSSDFISYANAPRLESELLHKFIHEEASSFLKLAIVAWQFSSTYCQISDQFLMPQLTTLDSYFTKNDEGEASRQVVEMDAKTKKGIGQAIEAGKAELGKKMQEQITRLQSLLKIESGRTRKSEG